MNELVRKKPEFEKIPQKHILSSHQRMVCNQLSNSLYRPRVLHSGDPRGPFEKMTISQLRSDAVAMLCNFLISHPTVGDVVYETAFGKVTIENYLYEEVKV